jgi:hypothetical protein
MARRCHRQKTRPILFLLRSSSLGEGCTERHRTRESSWTLFVLLVDCLDGIRRWVNLPQHPIPSLTQPQIQLVEMVKFTVILAWVSTGSAP